MNIQREITPLTQSDCFTLFSRRKKQFDFPLHYHEEYELNLILNAKNAKRIVGNHIHLIDDLELVFVGPNLSHAWFTHECKSSEIIEVTIQFHKDFLDETILRRNQLSFIRNLFERSKKGIAFSTETIKAIKPRILDLCQKNGFDSVLELLSILHDLSISRNMVTLSDAAFINQHSSYNSRRIEKVFEYLNANYSKQITLADVAKITNMPDVSFSRFIKKRTGKTFIDSLNEIRLGHASRLLIDTTTTISEIAYSCGFNNISNFNRIFKRKKNTTPKQFRDNYSGTRVFI
ncbi:MULTISPECIES: AraC family transcriptional regulator [Pedobacter]|uniref:Helix-turn-helix-domain containing protein AraC type n=1 Tax=Pedobacter heparinus (strain ATCC 13125 / DSM 2366 / CIP 104194 / JCM 7457 / NBRC 12017 / NCIMB 9290 / NRRL B-14731 / HIM 762-3) TaxID=485917 RepID=C6XVV2_PEDHD|nr:MULTISPECIES: AraC family transcriptional regulator [Pedobacter]ACU06177.1 helix-turn-helix- domain containing protein AraC type [Pedobacter heparinus DSM 2366]MBB5439698.1 AraC-like DNA-binding protein [Pedobacter sp. AK017]